MARVTIIGATGGLGANILAAALQQCHEVTALVRARARATFDSRVRVVEGDAMNAGDVRRAAEGSAALFHCANPPFIGDWISGQRRMAEAAIAAARACDSRLVFPGNVWVFGPRRPGDRVDDDTPYAPTSKKGTARAQIEALVQSSGARWTILRTAEFYGPHVATLMGPPLRALARGETATWYGPPDVEVQFAFMPDMGRLYVAAGLDPRVENRRLNVPCGELVTPRSFFELARARAGGGRVRFVPAAIVRLASPFHEAAGAFADILHLWTHPTVMATNRWRSLALPEPGDHPTGIDATLGWLRANPAARMMID
jgi:nucleoside-diphosphate-sugar epimerase